MFHDLQGLLCSRKSGCGRPAARTISAVSLFLLAFCAAQLIGCRGNASFDPALAGTFFPLHPGSIWTYRILDKNHDVNEIVTDRAVGAGHIDMPKIAGQAVSESSSLRAGKRQSTILYVNEDGYITRLSGVGVPSWVLYEERRFLPQFLKPGMTWSNSLYPFGRMPGAFHIVQNHRTYLENRDVVVPAGRFSRCIRIETDAVYQASPPGKGGMFHLKYLDWYAPHVGLVKTQVMKSGFFFGSEIARLELLTFADSSPPGAVRFSNAASAPAPTLQNESLHRTVR